MLRIDKKIFIITATMRDHYYDVRGMEHLTLSDVKLHTMEEEIY